MEQPAENVPAPQPDAPSVTSPAEAWADGAAYERFIGRWSRPVGLAFLEWLAVAPGGHWLDVGCGTGALSRLILLRTAPAALLGVDPAERFVAFARAQLPDARARFEVGAAEALPAATEHFDAAVAGLVLNFVPRPAEAVAEMARAVRPGGVVAAYVWDYAGDMELLRFFWSAAAELDPTALPLDEGRRFPLCQPEALRALFVGAHLQNVAVRPIVVATPFADFDDFWTPFEGGQGPAPGYVKGLSADQRARLREALRARLPVAPDGTIPLRARAWAVRGVR